LTMSDFAPFVAAALRDNKAMDDLLAENQRLRERLSKTRAVEITGTGGSPVYAKGMMNQREYGGAGDYWNINVTHEIACPLDKLCRVEIRLGGALLLEENCIEHAECHPLDFLKDCFDERGMGMFEVVFGNRCQSVSSLGVCIGPYRSYGQYFILDRNPQENGRLQSSNFVKMLGTEQAMEVTFQTVEFSVSKIQSALEIHEVPEVNLEQERAAAREAMQYLVSRAEVLGHDAMAAAFRLQFQEYESEGDNKEEVGSEDKQQDSVE